MSTCPLCDRIFDSSLSNEYLIHVNACLDHQEQMKIPKNYQAENEARLLNPLIKKQRERQQANDCVICGKVKASAAHIKKCGKQYGVETKQLINLVNDNERASNPNLQKIILKDSNLDQSKVLEDLFKENDNLMTINPSLNSLNLSPNFNLKKPTFTRIKHSSNITKQSEQESDFTIVLEKAEQSIKDNQTKLKVVRKSKSRNNQVKLVNEVENGFSSVNLHSVKERKKVKLKRKPLVKANLDDIIIQNFKDEYVYERELPLSWKLSNLNFDSSDYIVNGFENFCQCFDFKDRMNGFEIGSETKK